VEKVAVLTMDIHKKFSKAVWLDENEEVLGEAKVMHGKLETMERFFMEFEKGTHVVMEATFNWPWIADLAEAAGLDPHLVHALMARARAKGMAKNDRKDAIFLGKLFLSGSLFPEAYLAPKEVREARSLFRTRSLLVRMRTALKNNVHGQLFRMGLDFDEEVSDVFSRKGRNILNNIKVPDHERHMLDRKLGYLDTLGEHIALLEFDIKEDLKRDPRAEILMSIPGVGEMTAYAILSEIGEIERFPSGRALAAYAGVLPLDDESAGKDFGKKTGVNCNYFLKWAAVEAVSGAVRGSSRMKSLHSRVKARNKRMPGKARVAVAREIMELVYLLLTRGVKYMEKPPARPGSEKAKVSRRSKAEDNPNRASQTSLYVRSAAKPQSQTDL